MNFTGCWISSTETVAIATRTPSISAREISSSNGVILLIGQCLASDAQVASAYHSSSHAEEPGAATGWPGCYSSAQITRSDVILITDPVGQFPLYVAEHAGDVWFGTRPSDIAKHLAAPLDTVSLAVVLACPESSALMRSRSMYRGVRQISEGRILSIGRSGIRERDHATLRLDSKNLANAAERLRLSLSAAVRARVTPSVRVTADLSGGLDSTSLALLAREHLDVELPLLTYVNPEAPVTDDLEHARHHVRTVIGLRQHLVRAGPEYLPYQVLGPVGEMPHSSSVATGALRARLRLAAELGSRVHLVGEGGDVVVGAPPAYLADLARRGNLARLWRDCVAWARLRGTSPLALFRRAILLAGTTRRSALRTLAAKMETGRLAETESWERDRIAYWAHPHPQWLTRAARQSLATHIRDTADRLPEPEVGVADTVTMEWVRQQALTLSTAREVGAEFGIEVHAPFMDTEVVRACLSLPAHRRADPAMPKPLLRAALAGSIPRAVLARTTKGDYTRDAYLGVRRAAPMLRRLLSESVAADYGILEPGPVREVLEGAVRGMPTPWGALNQVLAVEAWLRKREGGYLP